MVALVTDALVLQHLPHATGWNIRDMFKGILGMRGGILSNSCRSEGWPEAVLYPIVAYPIPWCGSKVRIFLTVTGDLTNGCDGCSWNWMQLVIEGRGWGGVGKDAPGLHPGQQRASRLQAKLWNDATCLPAAKLATTLPGNSKPS